MVAPHPAAIDVVLPAPDPGSSRGESTPGGHRVAIPGADECQGSSLRCKCGQTLAGERAAQVSGERWALTDRVYPGLRPWVVDHGGDVAGSENVRVRGRSQAVVDGNEAPVIGGKPGVRDPRRRCSGCDPDRHVNRDPCAPGAVKRVWFHPRYFVCGKHFDLSRCQHVAEDASHSAIVMRKNLGLVRHQEEARVTSHRRAQSVLKREEEFHAPAPPPTTAIRRG